MDLGQKLRQARKDAGLSQRQLCGDVITRNMLSQIESGKAMPSMATLQYLAGQLGKPMSFFLEEQTQAGSPNLQLMQQARQAYRTKRWDKVLRLLQDYRQPDALLDEEMYYLSALAGLEQGRKLLEAGEALKAVPLLEGLPRSSIYYREDMDRQRRQLLNRGYELLEQHFKQMEDYRQAYEYVCKARALPT